jgi:single-stranded-DNA-specific exonuclease
VLAEATAQAEARGTEGPLVWAAGAGWHPGVVGIVAARLKEAFRRPAVVIGLDADTGAGKGSGRSIEGVDLGASIATLAREGLIARGGGHRMAAGLTLDPGQLEPAMDRLAALLARQGAGTEGPRALPIDGVLAPAAATPELVAALEDAGPYGAGSPAPRVAMAGLRIAQARRAGANHLSLALADAAGGRIAAIAFRAFDTPLGPALEVAQGRTAHLAGRLELDDWGGRRQVKLRLEDAAFPD